MERAYRVLVVDTGPEFVEIARKAAELSSWELCLASEKEEGIRKAVSESPDLIIVGYLEPQGEAFQLHRYLKEHAETRDIPQVVIDVMPQERLSKGWQTNEGLNMEAEDYLCQPITPSEFAGIVNGILSESRVVDTV